MKLKPLVLMGIMGLSVALACPLQTGKVANGLFAAPNYVEGICDAQNSDWLYFQAEVAKTDTPEWTEFYTVSADQLQPSKAHPEGLDPLAEFLDQLIAIGFTEVEEPENPDETIAEAVSTQEIPAETDSEIETIETSTDISHETPDTAKDLGFEAEQYLKFERVQQNKRQQLTIYVHQVLFENEPAKNVYQIGLASSLQ